MAKKDDKTNVMRLLDAKKLSYRPREYDPAVAIAGLDVAALLGEDTPRVFKTLVTTGRSAAHYVFMVPVAAELDLKKAARAAGEKSIEMLRQKELLPLTGYIHGGCSPIGMKKTFPTFVDQTALDFETIFFSAGKPGFQVELAPRDLEKMIRVEWADLTV